MTVLAIDSDPIERFVAARARARESEPLEAQHVALATADASGAPSVRMVLVKDVDADGFHFYTSYESRKARELEANPRGALCFHWPSVGEQVRVEGRVVRSSAEQSDLYFASRPRVSQLGAWASRQSAELTSRAVLEDAVRQMESRFGEAEIPRPPTWGGFVLMPERIEFWKEGPYRLHDREEYSRVEGGWKVRRLWP